MKCGGRWEVLRTATVQENLLKASGILLLALVIIFLLAPSDIAEYTIVDTAYWGRTNASLLVKTAYDYNNQSDILRFPKQLGSWKGHDFRYPESIYESLQADVLLSRAYWNGGDMLWMDIINSKIAKSFHNPKVCYGSQFNITNESVVEYNVAGNRRYLALSKMYSNGLELQGKRNPNDKQVVFYWYMYKIFGREHGCTMIRLSAPVKNSTEETFNVMKGFVEEQLFSEMYEKGMQETKTVAEDMIAKQGALGGFAIVLLLFVPFGLIFSERLKKLWR